MSLLAAAVPLAAGPVLADSDKGKGSPIGLFVVLILVVATYLLYRSMSRHLRRVPESFPGDQSETGSPSEAGSASEAGRAEGAQADDAGVTSTEPADGEGPDAPGSSATGAAGTGSRLGTESGERTGPS